MVLLNSGLIVHVDPPDGIDRPDGLTYLSRAPWRRWDSEDDDTWPAKVLPAEDYLRAYLEEALDRYRAFRE
ncbi:hypothetical protein ACIBQX_48590 [Nonomuraea sp. NPDC049714]|uniref:hypothetical protein n=1 Tax=Nonomuraea sp. NPDC049714 TaxID=3364357 RepID=UPI00378FA6A9